MRVSDAFGADDQALMTGTGIHDPPLDPEQVQYTTGYNDQYTGVSGQQTFVKSMAVSTANTIADQSNIKANTNIQYIAVDTGRATRTEDLLLDGASQAQNHQMKFSVRSQMLIMELSRRSATSNRREVPSIQL